MIQISKNIRRRFCKISERFVNKFVKMVAKINGQMHNCFGKTLANKNSLKVSSSIIGWISMVFEIKSNIQMV